MMCQMKESTSPLNTFSKFLLYVVIQHITTYGVLGYQNGAMQQMTLVPRCALIPYNVQNQVK